jgi:hypothetical protein
MMAGLLAEHFLLPECMSAGHFSNLRGWIIVLGIALAIPDGLVQPLTVP